MNHSVKFDGLGLREEKMRLVLTKLRQGFEAAQEEALTEILLRAEILPDYAGGKSLFRIAGAVECQSDRAKWPLFFQPLLSYCLRPVSRFTANKKA